MLSGESNTDGDASAPSRFKIPRENNVYLETSESRSSRGTWNFPRIRVITNSLSARARDLSPRECVTGTCDLRYRLPRPNQTPRPNDRNCINVNEKSCLRLRFRPVRFHAQRNPRLARLDDLGEVKVARRRLRSKFQKERSTFAR